VGPLFFFIPPSARGLKKNSGPTRGERVGWGRCRGTYRVSVGSCKASQERQRQESRSCNGVQGAPAARESVVQWRLRSASGKRVGRAREDFRVYRV